MIASSQPGTSRELKTAMANSPSCAAAFTYVEVLQLSRLLLLSGCAFCSLGMRLMYRKPTPAEPIASELARPGDHDAGEVARAGVLCAN